MYIKIFTCYLIGMTALLQSCQPTVSVPNGINQTPYFDLKTYFEKEQKRLASLSDFTKTTSVDGKTETKKMDNINWETELRIFRQSDINKPAWFDKYSVDSVLQNGNLTQISYVANDKELEMQNITIDFTKEKLAKISIEKKAETALADTQFQLIYEPEKGYSIENTQQLTIGKDKNFLVQVLF